MQTPVKYRRNLWRDIAKCKWLYVMLAIPLAQYILFRYAPLTGIQVDATFGIFNYNTWFSIAK